MSDSAFLSVIAKFEEELRHHEAETRRIKRTINDLCRMSGQGARYADAEIDRESRSSVKTDEYYGQPMATAVRMVLERNRAVRGALVVNEIYEELIAGGFKFDTKNVENAKRSLRISLGKNPIFHHLPNGSYGMTEWYPNAKRETGAEEPGTEE